MQCDGFSHVVSGVRSASRGSLQPIPRAILKTSEAAYLERRHSAKHVAHTQLLHQPQSEPFPTPSPMPGTREKNIEPQLRLA